MTFDDEKYKSLRNTLKSSAKVRAKGDFEARLFERIREAEKSAFKTDAMNCQPQVVTLVKHKKGFAEILAGLFKPAFAPALGLTFVLLIAVVVYFGYFNKMGDTDSNQVSSDYKMPEDLIIYVKGEASDSFSSNYPKEYSAVTENEAGFMDSRDMSAPTNNPTDHMVTPEVSRPGTEKEKEPLRLDKVSDEQRFEMQKEFKDGIETKGERKSDGIMKKEGKISPKKESKTENNVESEKSPSKIRDEKSNKNIDNDDQSGEVKQQVSPEIKANEQVKDTGDKDEVRSRISRAVKDSSKTNNNADDSNETIQQK
jgi:hypothetical protein